MNIRNNPKKTSAPVFKSNRRLDQLREQIHYLHYSSRTEAAYANWVQKFVDVHQKNHQRDMRQEQ
jgi:hypothetical protein